MKEHRLTRPDRDLAYTVRLDTAVATDPPRKERRYTPRVAEKSQVLDDDDVEQAV